jgi:xanthine/CO dehydrogenase XdhC/CoxF family maturation factor
MGCRGIVRILLEPFASGNSLHRFFQSSAQNRDRRFVATIVAAGDGKFIGSRIYLDHAGEFYFENAPESLQTSAALKNDAQIFWTRNDAVEVRVYDFGGVSYELFFENINPPLNLLLFGAGYDALPLISFAKEIGWHVTAIDHRAAFASKERLSATDEIIVSASEDLSDEIFEDENSVAVIMTHNYERDRNILRRLLRSKCLYIGSLGPKKRTEKLLAEINEDFTAAQLARLHAPVGLDIGADTPETIALSIVAEIHSVLKNRAGGFLRLRQGSIYNKATQ